MSKLLAAGAREGGHLTVQLKHGIPHIELLSRVFACCEGGEVSAGGLTSRRVSGLLAPALRGVVGRTAPVLAQTSDHAYRSCALENDFVHGRPAAPAYA